MIGCTTQYSVTGRAAYIRTVGKRTIGCADVAILTTGVDNRLNTTYMTVGRCTGARCSQQGGRIGTMVADAGKLSGIGVMTIHTVSLSTIGVILSTGAGQHGVAASART